QEDDGNQQKHAPSGRELHQHCLKQTPGAEHEPLQFAFFPLDLLPIDVLRIERITRLCLGDELTPKLLELEPFGNASPERAHAMAPGVSRNVGRRGHAKGDYTAVSLTAWQSPTSNGRAFPA